VALVWATPIDLPLLAPISAPRAGVERQSYVIRLVREARAPKALHASAASREQLAARAAALTIELPPASARVKTRPSALVWLPVLWLIGVLWCVLLTARELAVARRLRGSSDTAADEPLLAALWALCERAGLRRPPRLLIAAEI